MNKFVKNMVTLSALFALSGCSVLLPSSYNPIRYKNSDVVGEEVNVDQAFDAYIITPQLLNQLSPVVASAQSNSSLDQQVSRYQYTVGAGDVLNVVVWDHPELTTPTGQGNSYGNQVHANGTIFYPYVGNVNVAGLTVSQIRDLLTSRLADYIVDPQIEVSVANYQSKKVYVTGEVKAPGQQFISNVPLTLLDALNKAGGLSDHADWDNVTLTYQGRDEKVSVEALMQRGDLTQNRLLRDGEIVHIPRNDTRKVFVVGEVYRPQHLTLNRNGMTLMEAITASGGIDKLAADATGIFVIRGQKGQQAFTKNDEGKTVPKIADIYQLDVTNPTAYILATDFHLKPYDVVYVTTAPITRWNRVLSQIVPTISGANSSRFLGDL